MALLHLLISEHDEKEVSFMFASPPPTLTQIEHISHTLYWDCLAAGIKLSSKCGSLWIYL